MPPGLRVRRAGGKGTLVWGVCVERNGDRGVEKVVTVRPRGSRPSGRDEKWVALDRFGAVEVASRQETG